MCLLLLLPLPLALFARSTMHNKSLTVVNNICDDLLLPVAAVESLKPAVITKLIRDTAPVSKDG